MTRSENKIVILMRAIKKKILDIANFFALTFILGLFFWFSQRIQRFSDVFHFVLNLQNIIQNVYKSKFTSKDNLHFDNRNLLFFLYLAVVPKGDTKPFVPVFITF